LQPLAQGCEERATLGTNAKKILIPLLLVPVWKDREERAGERRVSIPKVAADGNLGLYAGIPLGFGMLIPKHPHSPK
jgi:hypothetical protein